MPVLVSERDTSTGTRTGTPVLVGANTPCSAACPQQHQDFKNSDHDDQHKSGKKTTKKLISIKQQTISHIKQVGGTQGQDKIIKSTGRSEILYNYLRLHQCHASGDPERAKRKDKSRCDNDLLTHYY
jgi:hypothetical protein